METKQKDVQKKVANEIEEDGPMPYELEVTPEESEIIKCMEECW